MLPLPPTKQDWVSCFMLYKNLKGLYMSLYKYPRCFLLSFNIILANAQWLFALRNQVRRVDFWNALSCFHNECVALSGMIDMINTVMEDKSVFLISHYGLCDEWNTRLRKEEFSLNQMENYNIKVKIRISLVDFFFISAIILASIPRRMLFKQMIKWQIASARMCEQQSWRTLN